MAKVQAVSEIKIPEDYDEKKLSAQIPDAELKDNLTELIEYDAKNQKSKSKELEETNKKIKTAEDKLNSSKKLKEQEENLDTSRQKLQEQEEDFSKAKETLEKENARESEAEKLHSELTIINESISKYDSLEEKTALQNKNKKLIESKNKLMEELKSSNELLSQFIESSKEKINSYSGIEVEIEKCETAKQKTADDGKKLKAIIDEIENLEKVKKESERLKSEYSKALKEASDCSEEYSRKLKAFLDAQAGILAQTLTPGNPCPVCGSTEHPKPAPLNENSCNQKTLDELKDKREELEDIAKEKSDVSGKKEGELKSQTESIKSKLIEMNIQSDIQKAACELNDKRDELRKEYARLLEHSKTLSANQKEKTELQKKIEDSQNELNEKTESCHKEETEIAALKSSVIENEKAINELKSTLSYSDKKNAEKAAGEIQDKIQEIKTAQENAKIRFDGIKEEISRLKGIISQQEKSISELRETLGETDPDIEKQENNLSVLLEKQTQLQDELDEIKIRHAQNKATSEKLSELQAKLEKIRETYQWMSDLDNVANGKISENGKIDLETYVQISIFDRILFYANQRLKDIAGNQYRLVRRQKSDDNRSVFGLDLDIQDNYTDKVRPVQGLSGGETFEASLALALGLSDEIQANAGGIELDCMFIDEGFGSLSEEPLDKAVNTLYSLAQGKKLVGIISHVERLNNRIDDKIEVTKDPVYGSSAKVITSKI